MRPIHAAKAVCAATVALTIALFAAGSATAQSPQWPIPGKTIRIVLPFPAGGAGTDMMARLVGKKLSEDVGVPVVVDNKPGASTIIGAQEVAKALAGRPYAALHDRHHPHAESASVCEAAFTIPSRTSRHYRRWRVPPPYWLPTRMRPSMISRACLLTARPIPAS